MALYVVVEVNNAVLINATTAVRIVVEEGTLPPHNIGQLGDLLRRAAANLPKSITHVPSATVPAKVEKGGEDK